jgi:hypothetical protein
MFLQNKTFIVKGKAELVLQRAKTPKLELLTSNRAHNNESRVEQPLDYFPKCGPLKSFSIVQPNY